MESPETLFYTQFHNLWKWKVAVGVLFLLFFVNYFLNLRVLCMFHLNLKLSKCFI
jgi:hypothetical protein